LINFTVDPNPIKRDKWKPKEPDILPEQHILSRSNQHSIKCTVIKSKITIKGNYDDIFQENISCDISRTLKKISEIREKYF